MSHPLPPKKEVALALLERSSVHVHLDPRGTAAVVPPWFKKQPQLVLQIGLNMPVPIPDLRLDDQGLSCTLSFNRSPFYCVVPWASVFAMVGDDGRGMVWPEEVPPEIAKQPAPPQKADTAVAAPARKLGAKRAPAPAVEEARLGSEKGDKPGKETKEPKGKKPRKKRSNQGATPPAGAASGGAEAPEPELRPMLVAVPRPAPSTPAAARRDGAPDRRAPARPEPQKKPAPARPQPAAADPRGSRIHGAPPKPKRELPPYLRVVK